MNDTEQPWIVDVSEPVLVTGANGFIGTRVVKTLLDYGFRRVQCFVRPSSNLTRLREVIRECAAESTTAIVEGNLLSRDDCQRASAAAVIFHLAAGMDKSFAGCFMNSVLTTRNLLDAVASRRELKRFVNVSSFAVYSNWDLPAGALFDEGTPLETHPQERCDPYGYAKLKQEQLVRDYHERFGVPYVVIRPGAVFGPETRTLTGRVGIDTFGFFLHLGGSNRVPFTFVDNCAEAIVRAGLIAGVDGEAFNVVDDDLPTSRHFLRLYKQHVRSFPSVPVPYPVSYALSALWEKYSNWSEGQLPPRFNRRRAAAEWKRHRYSNQKAKQMLGWTPRVSLDDVSRVFSARRERNT
jgi:nucleoside-diphosphate-sugar epimerase